MYHDDPHDVMHVEIRRTESGAIDTEDYHRRARAECAEFLRAVLSCIARCGWRAWGGIRAKMQEQVTQQELSVLSTRELKDLGLSGSDIDALASGAYFTDPTRYAHSRDRLRKWV